MNKKGALELSVNAIVILIIALVILGLILAFVTGKFKALSNMLTGTDDTTPKATPDFPIQLPGGANSLVLAKNEKKPMVISVYNGGTEDVNLDSITFSCAPEDLLDDTTFTAPAGTTVEAGTVKDVPIVVTVAGAEPVGLKSCMMTIGNEAASVSRTVNIQIK